ncbi:MAG: hypothetical protein GDA48_14035 [Hormoscilla sp. GM102CHS1]|nr:hypothetical protein [Hormoscilla sp. GM102CHS1]
MTTAYQPVAGCGESRKSGSERKDWGATPSSIPDARTFNVSKKSVIDWEDRLGELKPVLMLYAWLHQFIGLIIEGDELYCIGGEK